MKSRGPDSLEGIPVALICCALFTLLSGPAGLSSMLFVACISRYNTDRNNASLPFVLSNVLQAVSGPFTGYFAKKFGVRAVVLTGSILAPLGIGACFFAEDITTIVLFWGVIFGTGFGLSTLLLPVVINDYFFKQRSKALGLCYLGSPIGFFVFPPIFEILLEKYGLSGTFLFLSGIIMNCIPLSMLLRQPNFKINDENCQLNSGNRRISYSSTDCKKSTDSGLENSVTSENFPTPFRRFSVEFLWEKSNSAEILTNVNKQYILSLDKTIAGVECTHNSILRSFKRTKKNCYEDLDALSQHRSDVQNKPTNCMGISNHLIDHRGEEQSFPYIVETVCKETGSQSCNKLKRQESYEKCSTICFSSAQNLNLVNRNLLDLNGKITAYVCEAYPHEYDLSDEKSNCFYSNSYQVSSSTTNQNCKKTNGFFNSAAKSDSFKRDAISLSNEKNEVQTQSSSLLSMYFNPTFILMCIINAIASLHFSTLTTVIIDFSRDSKIDTEYEKYIMMCISIMGGVGMLGFGWVTDGGYLTRTTFGSLSQLVASLSTVVLPFTVGFETLMLSLAVWCICQASFIPLIPAIIADYIEDDLQAVAVSAVYVLCGPMYLIIPPLIGYFRDEKGSYNNIFFLLGFLAFLNCLALWFIPCLARLMSKRRIYSKQINAHKK